MHSRGPSLPSRMPWVTGESGDPWSVERGGGGRELKLHKYTNKVTKNDWLDPNQLLSASGRGGGRMGKSLSFRTWCESKSMIRHYPHLFRSSRVYFGTVDTRASQPTQPRLIIDIPNSTHSTAAAPAECWSAVKYKGRRWNHSSPMEERSENKF